MSTKLKRWSMSTAGGLFVAVLLFIAVLVAPAQAQVLPQTNVLINGEIETLTLDTPADVYSGGKMVVAGYTVILPKNLLCDLPANRLSLQQIFKQAPAGCVAVGQSGLAKTDTCNATGTGGYATITAVRTTAGDVIAGDVFIQKGIEVVSGTVTYINYAEGYFRMNGTVGSATTGVMVRLNDPVSRHTVQTGAGCAGGPNCSPDPRFTLDPDNYVTTFSTGYPFCIPSTVPRSFPGLPALTGIPAIPAGTTQSDAAGNGDLLCPSTNRTAVAYETAADSRRFAPIKIGDPVTAEGNFETIGGVRFLSSHTTQIKKSMWTKNQAGQPDYVFLEEVFIEAPAFQNQRMRAMWIGFTTMEPAAPLPTDVDIWSIHRDPITNAEHEFPLASVKGCDLAAGTGTCSSMGLIGAGVNIFRIRYDVDYLMAAAGNPPGGADVKLSPCAHLTSNPRWATLGLCAGGDTLANNFGILQPEPHEIIARTGHKLDSPAGSLIALDINGLDTQNGEYLFPLGMNLGGIETAEMNEIDLNQLSSPVIFEGIPWNLDRRLSPSGCLNNLGNPAACPAGPPIPLDPFPYTGLDPRTQADFVSVFGPGGTPKGTYSVPAYTNTPLTNASDRVRSYVTQISPGVFNFDGNNTRLAFTLAVDPPSQGVIGIPVAPLTMACRAGGFAPVAQNDTAVTNAGVAVIIPVLLNDIAPTGVINFASIAIVSGPTGSAVANLDGTVTFTPNPGFSGTTSFTYTVAELAFGAVSNAATVTITVVGPPIVANDSAVTNKNVAVLIPVLANDSAPSGTLDPASVIVTQLSTTTGTAVVNTANGTITYTPALNAIGNDTFTYTVANNLGARSASATVSVIINDVLTPPLAVNDTVSVNAGATISINVIANDQVFGTGPLGQVTIISAPSGSAIGNADGTVTYTPPVSGAADSFTYTVQDSASPTPQNSNVATVSISVNGPPTANAQAVTVVEDTATAITLTGTDPNGGTILTFAIVGAPSAGSLTGTPPNLVYTPNLNNNAADSFTFTVSDGVFTSAAATVSITITPVNDPPTANAQAVTVNENAPIGITLTGTDPDSVLTFSLTGQPLRGTLSGTAPNLTYTPNPNINGPDFFTFVVSDLTTTSAPATVTITITAINSAPLVVNDTATTTVGVASTISVLANDTDVDGTINAASVIASSPTANGGTAVANANGTVTYTPPAAPFSGTDTFTYTVADNLGAVSAPATVTVTVSGSTETVAVALAQFRFVTPGVSGDWRIEGTGTPNTTVTIHVGSTIPGTVVGTAPIAADGRWRFQATSTVLPDATNSISVVTTGGASRLAFPVAVR